MCILDNILPNKEDTLRDIYVFYPWGQVILLTKRVCDEEI